MVLAYKLFWHNLTHADELFFYLHKIVIYNKLFLFFYLENATLFDAELIEKYFHNVLVTD